MLVLGALRLVEGDQLAARQQVAGRRGLHVVRGDHDAVAEAAAQLAGLPVGVASPVDPMVVREGSLDGEQARQGDPGGAHETSPMPPDRKSTRLNSSHANHSYAVFCLKKKNYLHIPITVPRRENPSYNHLYNILHSAHHIDEHMLLRNQLLPYVPLSVSSTHPAPLELL